MYIIAMAETAQLQGIDIILERYYLYHPRCHFSQLSRNEIPGHLESRGRWVETGSRTKKLIYIAVP